MCNRTVSMMLVMIVAALVAPGKTFAQPAVARDRGPVSVVFDGGFAAGSPGAGPAIGARLTFDVNDRVGIEGAGSWAGQGSGADAASLVASILVNLTRADRKAVPYAAFGGGVYGAMFDMGDRRFFGMMGSEYAGTQVVPIAGMHGVGMMQSYTGSGMWNGPWSGPTWDVSQMPMFYLQRMGAMPVPTDGRWGMHRFSDPAISVGGGVRMDITERVYFRPEVRALVLFADGRSATAALFTIGLGYRF